jgi:hypothetical protein
VVSDAYDLSKLDSNTFEQLINTLVLHELGSGATGFGPGPDAGRDCYFRGRAAYPSPQEQWDGDWHFQCKFHKPHLSKNQQEWLVAELRDELESYENPEGDRVWPTNLILVTNIDLSGKAGGGAFDKANALVKEYNPAVRFDVWGGSKVIDLLIKHPNVARRMLHFITPGDILYHVYRNAAHQFPTTGRVIRELISTEFEDDQYTRLDEAGSPADQRPKIHRIYLDLPYSWKHAENGMVTPDILMASAGYHGHDADIFPSHPRSASTWFIKAGPGQGKSTIGQFLCHIHRAALILSTEEIKFSSGLKKLAREVRESIEFEWPAKPRLPIRVGLKEYARWRDSEEQRGKPKGVMSYLGHQFYGIVQEAVPVGLLRAIIENMPVLLVFDGLDEVPTNMRGPIAKEVRTCIDEFQSTTDTFAVCTSRPQGYGGEFESLGRMVSIDLSLLDWDHALKCAELVIEATRTRTIAQNAIQRLQNAAGVGAIQHIMRTPLQAHIVAVIMRTGGNPPERRWELYKKFYSVIFQREANRDLLDTRVAALFHRDDSIIGAVHSRLGFVLHTRAEKPDGAGSTLSKDEFRQLVSTVVNERKSVDRDRIVAAVLEAATERLVLISTPDDQGSVRFDVRTFQEFFAAEFLYERVEDPKIIAERVRMLAPDAHWREVLHFLTSALIERDRHAEVVAAAAELRAVDSSEPHDAVLSKHLGLGARCAGRLLIDGILEQDKRVRERFRDHIRDLSYMNFSDLHNSLSERLVNLPESRRWLCEIFLSAVEERRQNPPEGACVTLWRLMLNEGDDDTVRRKFEMVLMARTDYLVAAMSGPPRHANSDWQWRLIDHALTAESPSVASAMVLQRASYLIGRFGRHEGFRTESANVISVISAAQNPLLISRIIRTAMRYRRTILGRLDMEALLLAQSSLPKERPSGIVGLLWQILMINPRALEASVEKIYDCLGDDARSIFAALPFPIIRRLVSKQDPNDPFVQVDSARDSHVEAESNLSIVDAFSAVHAKCGITKAVEFVAQAIGGFGVPESPVLTAEQMDVVVVAIGAGQVQMSDYGPELWNLVSEGHVDGFEVLRRHIVEGAWRNFHFRRRGFGHFHINPTDIRLPEERNLIPILASALLVDSDEGGPDLTHYSALAHFSTLWWDDLFMIVCDNAENMIVRMNAVLLLFVSPQTESRADKMCAAIDLLFGAISDSGTHQLLLAMMSRQILAIEKSGAVTYRSIFSRAVASTVDFASQHPSPIRGWGWERDWELASYLTMTKGGAAIASFQLR